MRLDGIALLLSTFLAALPGYHYRFPADHFNHPDFQTEWWYYTGNVQGKSGRRFGFELTFFRQATSLPPSSADSSNAVWRPDQIYLAHLALTDIAGGKFFHTERLNRAGPGLAGGDIASRKYWNGNWQAEWKDLERGEQGLRAVCDRFKFRLDLSALKPPVIHGKDGVSLKGPGLGESSHYLSFTRLLAKGEITLDGKNAETVSGTAWMDHEFFTQPPSHEVAGWDWFAIQLSNNEELMLYRLRDKSGAVSAYSSGTYIDQQGLAHNLTAGQIVLSPGRLWHKYPVEWQIAIPSLGLQLSETTDLDNQELATPESPSPSYWEGAVAYRGSIHRKPAAGVGYLEMTGYSQPIRLGH